MSESALNGFMEMMTNVFSSIGMLQPDPETQRQIQATRHNNGRVMKAWDMFMTLIANGESASSAMGKVEKAIEIWQEYEDKNWMEPPIPAPPPRPKFPPPIAFPSPSPNGPSFGRSHYQNPPVQSFAIAIELDNPNAGSKVAEYEPGALMVFEDPQKAVSKADELTKATGKTHTAIAFASHFMGQVCMPGVDFDPEATA